MSMTTYSLYVIPKKKGKGAAVFATLSALQTFLERGASGAGHFFELKGQLPPNAKDQTGYVVREIDTMKDYLQGRGADILHQNINVHAKKRGFKVKKVKIMYGKGSRHPAFFDEDSLK